MRNGHPIDRMGGRKFLVAVYLSTMLGALCWNHRVTSVGCVTGLVAIAGLYKAANVAAEKMKDPP